MRGKTWLLVVTSGILLILEGYLHLDLLCFPADGAGVTQSEDRRQLPISGLGLLASEPKFEPGLVQPSQHRGPGGPITVASMG